MQEVGDRVPILAAAASKLTRGIRQRRPPHLAQRRGRSICGRATRAIHLNRGRR